MCNRCNCVSMFNLKFDVMYKGYLFLCWEFKCYCLVWGMCDKVKLFLLC